MRVAFLIPAPDYPEPWRWAFDGEAQALIEAGCTVEPVAWTDPGDLAKFDLILPLVVWGYHLCYDDWLALLDRFEAERLLVINPPALLRWNSHKRYLAELADRGVPTVPTIAVEACTAADLADARRAFARQRLVIKPPVSASASGTFLLEERDALPTAAEGQPMIIQPMIETIASVGEYSLILFDGTLSHAVIKRPKPGDFRVQPHLGGVTEPCQAPPGAEALAKTALAAAPAAAAYARVDIIPDEDGTLKIMELELIEPALFLDEAPERGPAFAQAILSAAERASK